nr:MAG TPA: hypothetical protein [Caudoviricetes sp.]
MKETKLFLEKKLLMLLKKLEKMVLIKKLLK